MATQPTITVTADPAALEAAMKALTAYNEALTKYEEAEAKATETYNEALSKAMESYSATIGKAKGELDVAEKAAKAAGVNFSTTKRSSAKRAASGGSRAPRASEEQITEAINALVSAGKAFTLKDVGVGSPATIRKVIDSMCESGKLTDAEPVKPEGGRGRAAAAWQAA